MWKADFDKRQKEIADLQAVVSPTRASPKIYVEFITPGEKYIEDVVLETKKPLKSKSAKRSKSANPKTPLNLKDLEPSEFVKKMK